ncbi:MAG: PVC-type heme-binding CxxCH protein [Opitutaceae bacterium]
MTRFLSLLLIALALFPAGTLPGAARDPIMAAPPEPFAGEFSRVPPTPPQEAAKTFRILDGFRMDLLASEPLVASPVAMTYDENGRAYVCEMRDYPYTDKARHKPGQENPADEPIGRVRLLEDVNGDGVFDRSTVFARDLSWPTGVACWKGGVFVAATPDIWYLKDTDGDGKADVRRKVFAGFRKYNVQAVMNNLVWGLDNWIHGAGGSNGGEIRPGGDPEAKPLVLSRNDFRFDPVTETFELMSGGARFGGTFDDWGNRFLCNIRNPAQHIVLPLRYLARNPALEAPRPIHDMAESGDQLRVYPISPPEPWRVLRARRWAGRRDIVMPRSELVGGGVVTSSSGITSYRGAAYPKDYYNNVFVAECAGNLFYRLQLTPDGATFKAARVDGKAEMAASTDTWFRPVNFVNAPDGTLHVLDMYREYIEHPWSIPDDIHAAIDLESGRERGRIWRLTPPDFAPGKPPRLGRAATAELVAALENPNAWWRETAQRLLFERQDRSAAPALQALVRAGRTPQARLHALWTLHGLGEITDDDVRAGLADGSAGVRTNAVKLAESRALLPALAPLAADPSARVRFQLAFSLGEFRDPQALETLAAVVHRDAADPWIRTAILSSVGKTSDRFMARLLADRTFAQSSRAIELLRDLSAIVGARGNIAGMQRVLEAFGADAKAADPSLNIVVAGIGDGLQRAGGNLRRAGFTGEAARTIDTVLTAAAQTATDRARDVEDRVASIRLLAFDAFERVKETLGELLAVSQPRNVQIAAIEALGSFAAPETSALLLAHWNRQTPAVRSEVVDAMLGRTSRMLPLMEAVEAGVIPASQIPFAKRRLLLRSTNAQVEELAAAHFGSSAAGARESVVESYSSAFELKGEPDRGRKVFETACIICHRAGDIGTSDIGPNLATVRAWSPDQILLNTLDPNREVAPNYLGYTMETTDGRSFYGLIAGENTASVTLRKIDGDLETVSRRDIAKMSGAGQSLMPEGLEASMTKQDMADLIAFLRTPEHVRQ